MELFVVPHVYGWNEISSPPLSLSTLTLRLREKKRIEWKIKIILKYLFRSLVWKFYEGSGKIINYLIWVFRWERVDKNTYSSLFLITSKFSFLLKLKGIGANKVRINKIFTETPKIPPKIPFFFFFFSNFKIKS